ncbi:uncharacterized protein LOC135483883 [Lineus longissimus]|uniref:uncharacterized protein LOC135483883 n=1 Tax=Lineus longissimus TaxID=88925 RepID=UPI002B4E10B6
MAGYSQRQRQEGNIQHIQRATIEEENQRSPGPHSSRTMAVVTPGVRTHPGYDKVAALVAGSAQVIIGCLLIFLGIAIAVVSNGARNSAHPMWGGVLVVVAGALAIVSAKNKRRDCIIIALGVTAFVMILDIVFFAVAGTAIGEYKKVGQSLWKALLDDLIALWALVILFAIIHLVFVVVQVVFCAMALRGTCVTKAAPVAGQVYTNDCIPSQSFANMGTPTAAGQLGPIQGGNQPCISLPLPMDPKQTFTIIYGPDKSGVKGCYFLSIMPEYASPQVPQSV